MKLKRLLPIASLAGVAAVVTPLVTSCNSGKTFVYTFDSREPAYQFTPENQIKADKQKLVWLKDASEDYLNDVKENKQILAEDLLYSTINSYPSPRDLSFGKATIQVNKIEPKTGKCSFLITADIGDKTVPDVGVTLGFSVKNMVYVMDYDSMLGKGWTFLPYAGYLYKEYLEGTSAQDIRAAALMALAYLKSTNDWEFEFQVRYSIHDQSKSFNININSETDDEVILQLFTGDIITGGIESFMFTNMYYWQNVGCRDYK